VTLATTARASAWAIIRPMDYFAIHREAMRAADSSCAVTAPRRASSSESVVTRRCYRVSGLSPSNPGNS
jgi:hypothetical protein